jgi:beta-lysine 5,6-aminomutase alpha subunit
LSIRSALYVFNAARDLGEQFEWREDSLVARFAGQILRDAVELLRKIDELGLFMGLEAGLFAGIKRSPEGGRGLDGVIRRNESYFNPFYEELLA